MFMKFKSSAFRQGFSDGFTSPFLLFRVNRTIEISGEDVVTQSWLDVAEAIRSSMPSGETHGKTTVPIKAARYKESSAA